jgi:hypothetical protein
MGAVPPDAEAEKAAAPLELVAEDGCETNASAVGSTTTFAVREY